MTSGLSLGRRASRGVAVTLGGQWARTLVQMISTIVLAHLLVPADFGLIAMVTAIVGFAELLRDFGLSGAIVQVKTIADETWRSLLWLSVLLGTLCTAGIAASAPLIALLYGDDRLVLLTLVLSPALLLNGICMPLQTKLQRDMRFGVLANIDVVSMVVGVAASIVAASLGFGVWSLVLLNGLGIVYRLVALLVIVRPRFGPPRIRRDVLSFVSSGGSIFGAQVLNYAARNLDNVIIGRVLGATVLGFYSRAYALLMLPISQLNGPLARVALPVLSQLQDDPERYRRYVRSALLVLGYVALPVFAISAAVSEPLVILLLGAHWEPTAAIFSILAIAGVAQTFGNVTGWIYISLGRQHRQLVYFLITKPIVVASFFFGIWWGGVHGLALVYGLVSLVLVGVAFAVAISGTFVSWRDIVSPIARPVLLAPFLFAAAWAAGAAWDLPHIVELLAGGVAGLLPLLLVQVIPAYRRDTSQILQFVRGTWRKS